MTQRRPSLKQSVLDGLDANKGVTHSFSDIFKYFDPDEFQ